MRMEKLQGFYELLGKVEAVHLDMDGSLIQSEEAWFRSEVDLLRNYGVDKTVPKIREITRDELVGRGQKFAARFYKENFGLSESVEAIREKRIALVKEYYGKVPMTEGAEKFLQLVGESDRKVTLATSAPLELAEVFLERQNHPEYFDHVVTDDHVSRSKPSPEIFIEAGKGVAVEPEKSLVVEDSKHGVLAAKGAGANCLWVPSGEFSENREELSEKADFIAPSLASLNFSAVRESLK